MDQTLKLQADPTDYLAGLGHEKIKTHLCRMLHTVCRFFQSTSVQIRWIFNAKNLQASVYILCMSGSRVPDQTRLNMSGSNIY